MIMFDGVHLFVKSKAVYDHLMQMLPGLVISASEDTGCIISHSTHYKELSIRIIEGEIPSIIIDGSLHKFFTGGYNNTIFTFRDIKSVVRSISQITGIDIKTPCIQHIEFGVNIPANSPEAIIDAAVLYHGRPATRRLSGKKGYYKEWEFSDYTFKLYKKSNGLLRYEYSFQRLRKLPDIIISSLEDITKEDVFLSCLRWLGYSVKEIVFVPGKVDSLPPSILKEWGNWRNDCFWTQLLPWKKTRIKQKISRLIKEYNLIDWHTYIRNGIISQGSAMMGCSANALNAMFSRLGLPTEKVAGPSRACDLKTMEWKDTVLVHAQCVGANAHWTLNVSILVIISYFPLLPRGPPSLLLVFLSVRYLYSVALLMPVVSRMSLTGMVPVS